MYRNDNRINLDRRGSVEDADIKISNLVKTLHLTICKINCIHRETTYKIEDVEASRKEIIEEYKSEEQIIAKTKKKLLKRTKEARKLTQNEVNKIRDALDIIQEGFTTLMVFSAGFLKPLYRISGSCEKKNAC